MASAKAELLFSKTLNFLLIWSLLLVILVAIMVKSLPYSLNRQTKLLISCLVQYATLRFWAFWSFWIFWVFFVSLSWRVSSSMKVPSVETVNYALEFSWLWEESTVMQKTLPAEFKSREVPSVAVCVLSCVIVGVCRHFYLSKVRIKYKRIEHLRAWEPSEYNRRILYFFYIFKKEPTWDIQANLRSISRICCFQSGSRW